jgi:hypothetical protein
LIANRALSGMKKLGDIDSDATIDDMRKHYGDVIQKGRNENIAKGVIIPIMVDDNEIEYIEDGWHRFFYYYDRKYAEIPVVKYL